MKVDRYAVPIVGLSSDESEFFNDSIRRAIAHVGDRDDVRQAQRFESETHESLSGLGGVALGPERFGESIADFDDRRRGSPGTGFDDF